MDIKVEPAEEEIRRVFGYVITTDRVIAPPALAGPRSATGGEHESWWYADIREIAIGREHRTRFLGAKKCIARIHLAHPDRQIQVTFKNQVEADYFFALVYGRLCRRGFSCQIGYSPETFERPAEE